MGQPLPLVTFCWWNASDTRAKHSTKDHQSQQCLCSHAKENSCHTFLFISLCRLSIAPELVILSRLYVLCIYVCTCSLFVYAVEFRTKTFQWALCDAGGTRGMWLVTRGTSLIVWEPLDQTIPYEKSTSMQFSIDMYTKTASIKAVREHACALKS